MISIRFKFLAILVGLVVSTIVTYLLLAVHMFEVDKEAYIYDSNASVVGALATETESLLASVTRTFGLIAELVSPTGAAAQDHKQLITTIFQGDPDLIDLVVYKLAEDAITDTLFEHSKTAYIDLHEISREDIIRLRSDLTKSPKQLPEGKLYLQNALLPGGVPLMSVALRIPATANQNGLLLVGQIQHDRLLKIFSRSQMQIVFLVDRFGNILAHPDIAQVAARENVADPSFFSEILGSPFKTGVKEVIDPAGKHWLTAFSKIDAGNLTVISKISRDAAFIATKRLAGKSALFAVGLIVLAFLISMIFSKSLTEPLKRLFEATSRIASGDFGVRVNVTTKDEVGALTTSFNTMAGKIVMLMDEVRGKARMEKELETARVVQDNLFPATEKQGKDYELAGFYVPASECGGDWWGYFQVENRLYVLLGDATGHGVPAALITAAAQSCCTTIQQLHQRLPGYKLTPATIMADLNAAIYHAAKGGMNMTFFIAMLDLTSGELTYSNASHEMPVICGLDASGDAEINMLMGDPDVCLGESTDSTYSEHKTQLKPDDALILYTDGLVESRNDKDVEWGERRFLKAVKNHAEKSAHEMRDYLIQESKAFCAGYPADDDITYVVIRWQPTGKIT